jgi:hypothetical protein
VFCGWGNRESGSLSSSIRESVGEDVLMFWLTLE